MGRRILTVDDSKTMRDMVTFTLKQAGFDVFEACDGQDALDKLKSDSADVVITDINMPNMNGVELVKNLRANPDYRSTPILVLTTESEKGKKEEGKAAGATGWIVKPFDPEKLVSVVQKVCP